MDRKRAALAAAAASLAVAGCGSGALTGKALQQEATSLQAIAAEGSLLADDAARGSTISPFLRVHAKDLRDAARSSAAALTAGKTPEARRLASLASRLSTDLDRLSQSSSDRATQEHLSRRLSHFAAAAAKLGKSL